MAVITVAPESAEIKSQKHDVAFDLLIQLQ